MLKYIMVISMKKETYIKMTAFFKESKSRLALLELLYSFLPVIMFSAYSTMLLYKFFKGINLDFLISLAVPAAAYMTSRIIRSMTNRERPYEKFRVPSAIFKDRKGKSLPSNHSVCAFVIAMVAFNISVYLWAVLMILALAIALTRILAGVHFISDVLLGGAFGILAGLVFIFI